MPFNNLLKTDKSNPIVGWDVIVQTRDGRWFKVPDEYEMPAKYEKQVAEWLESLYGEIQEA